MNTLNRNITSHIASLVLSGIIAVVSSTVSAKNLPDQLTYNKAISSVAAEPATKRSTQCANNDHKQPLSLLKSTQLNQTESVISLEDMLRIKVHNAIQKNLDNS